jgi:DNA-binding NarL/FixJ family response regulator
MLLILLVRDSTRPTWGEVAQIAAIPGCLCLKLWSFDCCFQGERDCMLTFVEAGKVSLDRLAKALVESGPSASAQAESVVLIVDADRERVKRIFEDHGLDCGAVSLHPDFRDRVTKAITAGSPEALRAEMRAGSGDQELVLFDGLNERDREVVAMVVEGLSNKEIGVRLGIAETSVKRALQRIFNHCGVRTRGQVVRLAMEQRYGARARAARTLAVG